MLPEITYSQKNDFILDVLSGISSEFISGFFKLNDDVISQSPENVIKDLRNFKDWSVFVFAIPIKDQVLWIWSKVGDIRYLFANYILSTAARSVQAKLKSTGIESVDVVEQFGDKIAMVELAEKAGLGTRGLNNLLLHPTYGSWLQIHALFINTDLKYDSQLDFSVCTECGNCIEACPAHALDNGQFQARRCSVLVAAPWIAKSKAVAVTAESYIECAECITSCPIGQKPEGIFEWKR